MAVKTPVTIFCFAGRRPNLELQIPMVRRILAEHENVRYDIWNFARNDDDRAFIKTIEGPQVTVWNGTDKQGFTSPEPTNEPGAKQFGAGEHNAAYRHYSKREFADHLFIKLDDDIVFLETGRFGKFVEAIDSHRGSVLVANIINNGGCTPIEPGIWEAFNALNLPLLDIHLSGEFADMVHTYFFDHHTELLNGPIELIPTDDWLSINAIGYDWSTLCHVLDQIGKPQPAYLSGRPMHGWGRVFGDEGVFQTLPRIIVRGFTTAHLTFGPQHPTDEQLDRWRDNYRQVADAYLNSAASARDDTAGLPGLSEVSCGYVGVRLGDETHPTSWRDRIPYSPTVHGAQWGPNNWRNRWVGENDPTVGRYTP